MHLVDNASCYEHYPKHYWTFVPTMMIVLYNKSLVTYPKGKLESISMTLSHSRTIISKLLLPISYWSQVDLHTPDLWLTAYPHMHIVRGNTWRFPICVKLSYVVYVPLSPPQHTLMGSHRKLGINLRFQISVDCSVSRSLREDLFTTCMLDFSINKIF